MKIQIIAVGTIKENYIKDGIKFYLDKLKKIYDIEIVEIKEEEDPGTPASREKVLETEGERILYKIDRESFVIALAIEGKEVSTEEFASLVKKAFGMGYKKVVFVIGGSLGIWGKVKERADANISFSKMTFPHQLTRLLLLEQIYYALL